MEVKLEEKLEEKLQEITEEKEEKAEEIAEEIAEEKAEEIIEEKTEEKSVGKIEEKALYLIHKDQDDYGQFKELVDSGETKIKVVNYPEMLYMNDGLKKEQKALFVGEIGKCSSSKKNVEYVFSKFGVSYGWAGPNRAYIDIDESLMKDKASYQAFLEEYSGLPVYAARKGDATRRNKLGKFMMTFVLPFGFIKTIVDSYGDAAAVKKQLKAYALIMFYNNHLQEFMDL